MKVIEPIKVKVKKQNLSSPHQKEQTCLSACLTLAHQETAQSHPGPVSVPPASLLCSHTPAEPF